MILEYLNGLIISAVCAGVLFALFKIFKKQLSQGGSGETEELAKKIEEASAELNDLLKYKDSYASKGQFDALAGMKDGMAVDLQREKDRLKSIEEKLDGIQKAVETKEFQQQEVKSAKEDDHVKLEAFLGEYKNVAPSATSIEQRIAAGLKSLDQIIGSGQFSEDQKGMLIDLQTAMTTAGSSLRELITDYEGLNERLAQLKGQHQDLEEEYTKLVEQQLGG